MGVIAWDASLKDEGVWICRGHTFQREPLPQVHVAREIPQRFRLD